MSKIILKSIRVPLLQVNDKQIPQNEQLQIIIYPRVISDTTPTSNEYIGSCKLEMRKESEKDIEEKSFYIGIELEGRFLDKNGDSDYTSKRDMVMKELLPHLNATLRTLEKKTKIPSSFIPEEILAELND